MSASLADIMGIFDEVDRIATDLGESTGLRCPRGCGSCCLSATIEVLPVEFLPLADELCRRGELFPTLTALEAYLAHAESLCFWYRDASDSMSGGHCAIYPWRPLVCRAFGFFSVTVKGNAKALTACPTLKHGQSSAFREAEQWVAGRGHGAPVLSDLSRRLALLDMGPHRRPLLLNQALEEALAFVATREFFAARASETVHGAFMRPAADHGLGEG